RAILESPLHFESETVGRGLGPAGIFAPQVQKYTCRQARTLQLIALWAMGFSPDSENPGGSKPPPYIHELTR
ncbi:MAG: hypothetical protein IKU31_03825, partial [Oscillospiraceae bacterium]|nr:hypothetical protein [Oscillospiraceae bacterium]